MNNDLIQKYDEKGPRYTSYPPVPFWKTPPTARQWLDELARNVAIDLYLHIPYCKEICHYCGCNRQRLDNDRQKKEYIQMLLKEWKLYRQHLDSIGVANLHLGGGTPTILNSTELSDLLTPFAWSGGVGSLEADPRTTNEEKLRVLRDFAFEKISFGVQDFDHAVQRAIGRHQPFELVSSCVESARKLGFKTVNFDLIFGLPQQSEETIKDTFKKVEALLPDTIAFYSFAYVPNFASNQERICKELVPEGAIKRRLYELGRTYLEKLGYVEIGMDHFALTHSLLYQSFLTKEMRRSFMGYTSKGSSVLLGLGASSISSSQNFYLQNQKNILQYYQDIESGKLAFFKGHCLSDWEREVASKIQAVMCAGEVVLPQIDQYDFSDLIEDGLIVVSGNLLKVTMAGRAFLRNICMRFDPILLNQKSKEMGFSRTI